MTKNDLNFVKSCVFILFTYLQNLFSRQISSFIFLTLLWLLIALNVFVAEISFLSGFPNWGEKGRHVLLNSNKLMRALLSA